MSDLDQNNLHSDELFVAYMMGVADKQGRARVLKAEVLRLRGLIGNLECVAHAFRSCRVQDPDKPGYWCAVCMTKAAAGIEVEQ